MAKKHMSASWDHPDIVGGLGMGFTQSALQLLFGELILYNNNNNSDNF